ncbi:DNA-binding response regulator [Niabella yanshanensis]|uniref:DNA-binding response regulator n=1 Tax=Niabella yanshanensis TaxID=577386 RepID=A0ABZ0W6P3_9BACT|nr:DNA-binding response regulator [Niabella yanshanensis]WQD38619.1 DNA-binding response regulator [Niabella yanshanensis]
MQQQKASILLVEDNEEILRFITNDLGDEYEMMTALNGVEAIAVLRTTPVSLIITDVMMPEMDGFELCRIVKSTEDFIHIPVIILTAKNTLQSRIEGIELGADAYIEKPFSPRHLRVQVATLLQNRDKLKQYFVSKPLVHIKETAHNKSDEAFLNRVNEAIRENIDNADLNVDHLASILNMSRASLYRRVGEILDISPNDLIKETRLKYAANLLAQENYKVYEVSDKVGFGSYRQFSRNFFKQFGVYPSEYIQELRKEKR